MKLQIQVKTNARQERVEEMEDGSLKVFVNAPPTEGKANEAVIRLLAKHFSVPPSAISITGGFKSKKKRVEIKK
ncbi:MAG: DUF167 domain-containing protein [bacterium]|nr:DUF167 domain-containing protein [bacterium]